MQQPRDNVPLLTNYYLSISCSNVCDRLLSNMNETNRYF